MLGHENCGAVKSAIAQVKLGNITALLSKIQPAVSLSVDFDGEQKADNKKFVNYVGEKNIQHSIQQIREKSPLLADMEKNGDIKIVGAIYQMETGKVKFL